ncbi:IclR family transcriptional regulator [Streptomyces sp. NBC_01356]|uniref:IclR family transcriptional regulator n=1 Tax=Streptomyces sp. NBC_01356 TaxID=2903836 RepID=UPI002E36F0E2|nr:IclR family transcriptional regulator [Streptomyces sp. NBC_01356]
MPEIAQTADHALRILEELGKGTPLTPTELCERLGLHRSVVHRLLATLDARGFVSKHGARYQLGVAMVRLSSTVEPDLRAVAGPVMSKISDAIGESVVLDILDGSQAVVLEQAVATLHIVQISHRIGSRHPLTSGASGRAILAFLPARQLGRALREAPEPDVLKESLDDVRRRGYATSHDELQLGVYGIAVPLLDREGHAFASMAILVPSGRSGDLERHVDALRAGAEEIQSRCTRGLDDSDDSPR